MSTCVSLGWGTGPWGATPWGAGGSFTPGGSLPVVDPFDIYCVGPCGPISALLTYFDVELHGDGTHVSYAPTGDIVLSGGAPNNNPVWIAISNGVPGQSTFETTIKFDQLPLSFSDVLNSHILIGLQDSTGMSTGLLFAQTGIALATCFRPDGFYNLVLDAPIQLLPDSFGLFVENEYYVLRIVTDSQAEVLYIYLTRALDLPIVGHQLRFVLPGFSSALCPVTPPDQTVVSVRGTGAQPTRLAIGSICLANGTIIPNVPPVADAGKDQAAQLCSIVQLDGSRSFDPEEQPITYLWRLIDAPQVSACSFSEYDGETRQLSPHAPPAQYTNRFYSASLGVLHATTGQAIEAGDVIVIEGTPYSILDTGVDLGDFFVRLDGYELRDDLPAGTFFHLLRQRYISGRTDVKPTFYPDVPGFYKFDLQVSDGALLSSRSTTVMNVVESPMARGCIPDMSFMWDYLTDFWSLVEDVKPRMETIWSAMAQIVAAEMWRAWQLEYSKSLRDIQRTFGRKWLHYDTQLVEYVPEATAHRLAQGGLAFSVPPSGLDWAGLSIVLTSDLLPNPLSFTFTGSNPLDAATIAYQLNAFFTSTEPRIVATQATARDGSGDTVRLNSLLPLYVDAAGTVPLPLGPANTYLRGTGGVRLTDTLYKVPFSLAGVTLGSEQLLLIGEQTYTIVRLVDDPGDVWPFQRILVAETLAPNVGATWSIPDQTVSLRTDFYNGCFTAGDMAEYEVQAPNGDTLDVWCPVLGASAVQPNVLLVDLQQVAAATLLQLASYRLYLKRVARRQYVPVDELVVDVPLLQPSIKMADDTQVLRRNIDFFVDTFRNRKVLRFISNETQDVWEGELPPERLWAEFTYLDNRPMIEDNFGRAAGVYVRDIEALPESVDYLSAVRGVWYLLFNGPTLTNLRVGAQVLLGLPFAEETSRLVEVRNDFSPTTGRLLLADLDRPELVRSYTYPRSLGLETNPNTNLPYAVGDIISQFAPLVRGVEVDDYVRTPDWFRGYMNQGAFFEVEKFFRFLVRVDSAAFSLSAMSYLQTLIQRVKPTYTYPLFVVKKEPHDATVSVTDHTEFAVGLNLHDLGVTTGAYGAATMFDEPDPSPDAPTTPAPVSLTLSFTAASLSTIPSNGYPLGVGRRLGMVGTVTPGTVTIVGSPSLSAPDYEIVVQKNGEDWLIQTFTFTGDMTFSMSGTYPVAAGDVLTVLLRPTPQNTRYPNITSIELEVAYEYVPLPAATGHLQSRYDASSDPAAGEPTTTTQPTQWGFDKGLLVPAHAAVGVVTYENASPFTPTYDTLFMFDTPVFTELVGVLYDAFITHVPNYNQLLHSKIDVAVTTTITNVQLRIYGGRQDAVQDYWLNIYLNGIAQVSIAFTIDTTSNVERRFELATTLDVVPGDVITAGLSQIDAPLALPWFQKVSVAFGTSITWVVDDTLPAGTYKQVREL